MRLSPAEVDERVSFFVCVKVGEGGGDPRVRGGAPPAQVETGPVRVPVKALML
jgi:hypothetical protein